MKRYWRISLIYLTVIICLGSVALAVWSIHDFWANYQERRHTAQLNAREQIQTAARQIDRKLRRVMTLADEMAKRLSDGSLTKSAIAPELRGNIDLDPNLVGVGVAFREFGYIPNLRLYGLAYVTSNGTVQKLDLDAIQDYTNPHEENTKWYRESISKNYAQWLEPTAGPRGRTVEATYAVPFFEAGVLEGEAKPLGVLYFVYSVDNIEWVLNTLELGPEGYSYILSKNGHFIFHPNREYVDPGKTVFDLSEEQKNPALVMMADILKRGESFSGTFQDPISKENCMVLSQPIPATKWSLGVVYQEDIFQGNRATRDKLIRRGLLLLLIPVTLCALFFRVDRGTPVGLWALTICFSICCVLGVGFVITVALTVQDTVEEKMTNKASLRQFQMAQDEKALQLRDELPLYVPTGIYVQSASFASANDVRLTGFVWQKYYDGLHDGVSRGFIMPESESMEIQEAHRQKEGNVERWVWKFHVVLHQEFDYSRYPFSKENIWIQLWHKDFIRNVILVPDLDSYKFTSPAAQPGVLQGLELPGWRIDDTYFSYRRKTYKASFGTDDFSGLTDFPELYFNIIITKQITGPFVSHLLAIIIIFVLLYTILTLCTRNEQTMDILGFNTMNVVVSCAGFFLVLIFSHIDLREGLVAKGIIYLEYFYCVTYIMILFVAINSLLFSRTEIDFFIYKENLIPKMLFWPISQFAVLVLTLNTFY